MSVICHGCGREVVRACLAGDTEAMVYVSDDGRLLGVRFRNVLIPFRRVEVGTAAAESAAVPGPVTPPPERGSFR